MELTGEEGLYVLRAAALLRGTKRRSSLIDHDALLARHKLCARRERAGGGSSVGTERRPQPATPPVPDAPPSACLLLRAEDTRAVGLRGTGVYLTPSLKGISVFGCGWRGFDLAIRCLRGRARAGARLLCCPCACLRGVFVSSVPSHKVKCSYLSSFFWLSTAPRALTLELMSGEML